MPGAGSRPIPEVMNLETTVRVNAVQLRVFQVVIPAKAGIQWVLVITGRWMRRLDSRFRGNDEIMSQLLTEQHCS